MRKKVVVVDYQLGNLFSVNQALLNTGLDVEISSNPEIIRQAEAIVLPGVGAFKDAMINLNELGILDVLTEKVLEEKLPFLGICLGLQLLFSKSEEFGETSGLGFVKGKVTRFPNSGHQEEKIRVPQIAWNTIQQPKSRMWKDTPLQDLKDGVDMYFVHSYYVVPENPTIKLSTTVYGGLEYTSSILQDNIFACQFHPEKSAVEGLKIYKKWAEINNLH